MQKNTPYSHSNWLNNSELNFLPGKIVCVGRNYAAHIAELGNQNTLEPLLFMKGNNAFCRMENEIVIPKRFGECHHELELALLIGEKIDWQDAKPCEGIWGLGLGLDLTLRSLQSELKAAGHPWEKAKAFDHACPLSPFVPRENFSQLSNIQYSLAKNGQVIQEVNTGLMLHPIEKLLMAIAKFFTLWPGDVVLTGTPAGVGSLHNNDKLDVNLDQRWRLSTRVSRS